MTRRPPPLTPTGPTRRPGYTLLEVILALALSVLLLAALYVTLNMQLAGTQYGRRQVEESAVARAVVNRIQADILGHLGPVDPKLLPSQGGSSSSSGTPSSSTTTPTTGTGTGGSGSGGTSGLGPFAFNLMLQGGSSSLTLYLSRVPREVALVEGGDMSTNPDGAFVADLRRVTFWQAGGDGGLGLARQEVKGVTSDDQINNLPPNVADE